MLLSKQVPSLAVSFLESSYRIAPAQGTRKILTASSPVGTDARNWNLAKQRGLARETPKSADRLGPAPSRFHPLGSLTIFLHLHCSLVGPHRPTRQAYPLPPPPNKHLASVAQRAKPVVRFYGSPMGGTTATFVAFALLSGGPLYPGPGYLGRDVLVLKCTRIVDHTWFCSVAQCYALNHLWQQEHVLACVHIDTGTGL